MLGHSLGLFPLFTPSFALWSPVTHDGIVPARSSSPTASLFGRILAEELKYEGPEQGKINNELMQLKNQLSLYFQMMGVDS